MQACLGCSPACTPLLVSESSRPILRIEQDRFIAVAQRLIGLTLIDKCRATIGVGHRIFWIELDRFIAVVQCLIGFTPVDKCRAAASVACRIFRIELNRLI